MGDRLATTDMGRKLVAVPLLGGAGSLCNTMWPWPRPTSVPSFILIHPTVWPQYTNVTDRTDKQTTDRYHRANRFTNGRPQTSITGDQWFLKRWCKCNAASPAGSWTIKPQMHLSARIEEDKAVKKMGVKHSDGSKCLCLPVAAHWHGSALHPGQYCYFVMRMRLLSLY